MKPTRIAIATADGLSVCDHLARSSAFLVLQIEEGQVTSGTVRTRSTDTCGHHASFVDLLDGCVAVICGGIGQGAADSLTAHGIEPLVTTAGLTIDEAVSRFLTGSLAISSERVCLCH